MSFIIQQFCRCEKSSNDEVFVMTTSDSAPSSKIASFDMDGTLITTASGRVFARDRDDWKIAFAEVPGRLKELANREGYKVREKVQRVFRSEKWLYIIDYSPNLSIMGKTTLYHLYTTGRLVKFLGPRPKRVLTKQMYYLIDCHALRFL